MTVSNNIIWQPSEKQAEFLRCPDYEVLYGGAAGGGKSDALLIDLWCIQDGGASNPNHRAVFFRRTFPELKDAIDRALELFPQFIEGIEYNSVNHIFTAPSGAKFEFGHLQNDNDRFKYRGRAWNAIGFDELTLWPTDICYIYLKSRNRSTDITLPKVFRSTTNPDGPGQKWVMDRWGIKEDGLGTRQVEMTEFELPDGKGGFEFKMLPIARTFIPAKLSDNPYLRGTGYREILMSLPDEERDALLRGLWTGNRVRGSYYFDHMQTARQQGRITRVPHQPGTPTNTFWDLGKRDANAIWCHQQYGFDNRFFHYYENSGEYLPHYVSYLQEMQQRLDITWGVHYLPHDATHERLGSESILSQLFKMWPGQKFQIVPRIPRVIDGINQTRACFGTCYFDKDECADGIASLDAYRKKWDNRLGCFTDEAEHDRYSNGADAFRQFGQGYPGNRRFMTSSTPEFHKKLRIASRSGRSPMAS